MSPTLRDVRLVRARRRHIDFIEHTWNKGTPFLRGFHTEAIGKAIDEAFVDFRNGKSTYLEIMVPYRHGKSDMVSRYLPPHFLGEFPECEVINTGYNSGLVHRFSRDARRIIRSSEFSELYPNSVPSREAMNIREWGLDNGIGRTLWAGLDSGLTGSGAHLAIVDDPFKGRNEVESINARDSKWEAFANDLFTRLAPVHILIVLATPWHIDDFFGRIDKKMKEDELFPRFKRLCFPARARLYKGEGKYRGEFLFEERFSPEWYETQYSMLGKYNASGLLDCDPSEREGMMISCKQGINWHYVDEKPDGFTRSARAWDLASSTKQVSSSDPDWTVGVKGAIHTTYVEYAGERGRTLKAPVYEIYIEDIVRFREESTKRNAIIQQTAVNDGKAVECGIEAFAGYKDTYTLLRDALKGVSRVRKMNIAGDKVTKASQHIIIPFDTGKVYVNSRIDKGVVSDFFKILEQFPSGSHDDDVDALAIMVAMLKENTIDYKAVNS